MSRRRHREYYTMSINLSNQALLKREKANDELTAFKMSVVFDKR
jgi:hypothetical protein